MNMEKLTISLDDLKKVSGIGEKMIQRIKNTMLKSKNEDEFESKYNPKIHLDLNKIHHGDCLELMHGIPDKSVNMILCDLPYGTTRNKWDEIISFNELWKHYKRIIKDNGLIILFGQGLFTAKVQFSSESWFKYKLVWKKDRPSGHLNAKKMPMRNHEDIVVFYSKLPIFNPQMELGKPNHSIGKSKSLETQKMNNNYGDFKPMESDNGELKYPKSVLEFKRPHPPIHPTQKPVELFEWLIKTYTNEGDLVLDNCIGSGTTAIACMNTNRNFIGIEKEKEYVDIARKRINKVQK